MSGQNEEAPVNIQAILEKVEFGLGQAELTAGRLSRDIREGGLSGKPLAYVQEQLRDTQGDIGQLQLAEGRLVRDREVLAAETLDAPRTPPVPRVPGSRKGL